MSVTFAGLLLALGRGIFTMRGDYAGSCVTFVARTASHARIEARVADRKEAALCCNRPSHTTEPDKRGRAAWQALSYRLSEFDFGVPAFALVYPPFTEFAGRYWSKRLGISAVKNIGLRLHVGAR